MNRQELLELIGRYGGLRDDAGYYTTGSKKANSIYAKATECFILISKELDELFKEKSIEDALKILKKVMRDDFDYAWSWHCNIACMVQDAGADWKISNEGASRFMKLLFDIDTTSRVKEIEENGKS